MVLQRERAAAVEAHDLEAAVAAQQPLVGDGDPRLLGGPDRAVQGGEEAHGREDIRARKNAPTRNRTLNLRIKSPLLCQLS